MKIVVLVKEVPDTYGDRKLNLETGLADRDASDRVLDEIGERAIEVALAHADKNPDVEIALLSVGPEAAVTSIRKGLAMGAGSAIHVVDEGLVGADVTLTAEVLAAALRKAGFDLVIAGNLSTDGTGGVVPAILGELLGVPAATGLSELEITGDTSTGTSTSSAQATATIKGVRGSDGATVTVSA
ncbi:MAG: electron transfer flavoprotein subunit beta, partial [Microbacterium sp.]